MNNAPIVRLGDYVKIRGGGTPSRGTERYFLGNIPWVTPKDMKAWELYDSELRITEEALQNSTATLVPANTVLLVVRSGVLKHTAPIALNRVPVAINQDMKSLECNSALSPDYLARILKALQPTILGWVRATTADNYSIENIRELRIPLPSIDKQRQIAAVLNQADTLVHKRRRALDGLTKLSQTIFQNMFGDPVANPKHWQSARLGDLIAFLQYGPRFYNEQYAKDGVRIVRITDLNESGALSFESMPRLAVSVGDEKKFLLKPGDIIFARTGATVGKVALIQEQDPSCIAGAYFITMRFKPLIHPAYARYLLTAPAIQDIVRGGSRQAAQQNFSGPALRRLPMPVPPFELQERFAIYLDDVNRLKSIFETGLVRTDELFASVEHRFFGDIPNTKAPTLALTTV